MANLIAQSPTTGGMSYDGIQNFWDALKDDINNVGFMPYGDEYYSLMNQIINVIGNREIAKQPQVKWFERNRQEVPFTVDNGPVSISSGTFTVDLPASEVDTQTGYSYPAVYDTWYQASTGYLYQIVSKPDANTIVLRPLDSTVTANIPDNEKFFYYGNTVPEGSSPVQPKYTFDTLYTSYLQTMRTDKQSTSESLYNQLWYDQLENGVRTPFANSLDAFELQRLHMVGLVNTFFAGQTDNNLSTTTSFQTTGGLLEAILDRGQLQDSGGDIDETDFYALEAKLSKQNGSLKNYMIWNSGNTSAQIEQNMLAYNNNVNIQIVKQAMEKTFWGEGAEANLMSTTFSFNALVFNNKNFANVRMGLFDNPQSFNVAGSNWQDYAFVLPVAQGQGVDDGLGTMGKYIRLAHKPGAFMNMWDTGGRAAQNKTGVWELRMHCVSEFAFKFINANNYGLFYNPA